jgi:DNA polymerase-3 subunit epsilon/exodeoxyribonuclease X
MSWAAAPIVALDLEGTGAQDRDGEAILEIAIVPLTGARPSVRGAYTTLINPQRPIPRRPWSSPGLTDIVLAQAPTLDEVTARLAGHLDGMVIAGHNVSVDWRLLHRQCPEIRPQGLIDTLRLARHVSPGAKGNGLAALLERHQLTGQVSKLAAGSQPHRALWDTIGAGLLLTALIGSLPGGDTLTYDELHRIAGLPLGSEQPRQAGSADPVTGSDRTDTLF